MPYKPTEGLTVHEWANLEFGASNLGHQDRNTRLIKSAETICMRPHYSANVAFQGDPSGSKGWYRFIATNQEKVSFDSILSGPMECTCRYMMSQDTVLIAQDDTKLNFTSKPQIAGMGSIGTNQTNAETSGCILHTLMAITTEGIPLGIVKSTCFTRHNKSEDENSKKRSPEEKESFVWIEHARYINQVGQYMQNTKIIMLCDRGADIALFIYETFYMKNCDLIVRAKNDRRVPGETQSSFALLQKEKPAGCIQVTVPRRSERPKLSGKAAVAGRKERKATLTIRYRLIKIAPPPEKKGETPIEIYAISATEDNPPADQKGICWRLLTTLPVKNLDDAVLYIKYYTKRWCIEEFHRMLKTGCQVENLAHKNVTRITRALAVYIVIACRLMFLLKLGRKLPDLPAEVLLDDVEIYVLKTMFIDSKKRPMTNLNNAIILVAKLGGYLDRDNDSPPGYEIFWKGYETLQIMCKIIRQQKEVLQRGQPGRFEEGVG